MKKIFSIFALLLILIMATVPCIAASSGSHSSESIDIVDPSRDTIMYSTPLPDRSAFRDTSDSFLDYQIPLVNISKTIQAKGSSSISSFNNGSFTVSNIINSTSGFRINNLIPGHVYFLSFYLSSDVYIDSTYFRPYSSGSTLNPVMYVYGSTTSNYFNFTFTFPSSADPNSNYLGFWTGTGYSSTGVTYFNFSEWNLFDLTVAGIDSSDLLAYIDPTLYFPRSQSHAYLIGFFDPLQDFWLSFTHLFDYFNQLVSTYSGLFVFVTICLSLCLVMFIVVMVIKRCRNI